MAHGKVAGYVGNSHRGAHGQCPGPETPVDNRRVPDHSLGRAGPHPPFQLYVGWDGVHRLAALGHNPVNPGSVLFLQRLPVGVDGLQSEGRCVEGIDTQVRRAARMGAASGELDVLDHVTIAGASHGELAVRHVAGRMAHHGHVYVVEVAQLD